MKSLFLIIYCLLPVAVFAQAFPKYTSKPVNIVDASGNLKESYEGSIKFKGNGTIPEEISMNDWTWLYFKAEDEIKVKSQITFGDNSMEIVAEGSVRFSTINMNGADTIYVKSGLCTIETITSRNSNFNGWNTIVVDEGAELYIAGMEMRIRENDITITTTGEPNSKIKIIKGAVQHLGMKR